MWVFILKGKIMSKFIQLNIVIVLFMMFGCSSEDGLLQTPQAMQVNECLARGSSYYIEYTEINGTCGKMPSETVTISPGGKVNQNTNIIKRNL